MSLVGTTGRFSNVAPILRIRLPRQDHQEGAVKSKAALRPHRLPQDSVLFIARIRCATVAVALPPLTDSPRPGTASRSLPDVQNRWGLDFRGRSRSEAWSLPGTRSGGPGLSTWPSPYLGVEQPRLLRMQS